MPTLFVIAIFSIIFGVAPVFAIIAAKVQGSSEKFSFPVWAFSSASLIFIAWFGISAWIMSITAQNTLSTTQFTLGDWIFGVDPRKWFTIPSVQLPTSILSFTFGFAKLWNMLTGGLKKILLIIKTKPNIAASGEIQTPPKSDDTAEKNLTEKGIDLATGAAADKAMEGIDRTLQTGQDVVSAPEDNENEKLKTGSWL